MDSKTFNAKVASALGCTPAHAAELTEAFADILQSQARSLSTIAVPSFGNFLTIKSDEEIIIDRSTGRKMLLPPQINVEFQPAAMLRKKIISHERIN
ncbi:MAG: HU family DNA-binding protein [Odoribacter sp.]|nr:HU family DNA-binding protein [Odoribacter sp.]